MNDFEIVIFKSLLEDEKYFGVVYPFLKETTFSDIKLQELFKILKKYIEEYGKKPSIKDFILYFKNQKIVENLKKDLSETLKIIVKTDIPDDEEFLYKESEKYIQKQTLTDSILKSAELIEKDKDFNIILGLIEEALSINFDTDLGLKFENDLKERYEYYTKKILGIPLGIPSIDRAMSNGITKKSLSIIVAPSHSGKCHKKTTKLNIYMDNEIYKKYQEWKKKKNKRNN